jgi:hypothetical protein
MDTDMASGVDAPKVSPEQVAGLTLDAVEAGHEEVLADTRTRQIKAAVPNDLREIYPGIQRTWDQLNPPARQQR